jgi:predicted Zn-dependent peptidase
MRYQITRLPNGLTIASTEIPHMASVCVGIWVGVGGRYEPAEVHGISHFIEHMLFKGTRRRTAKEISQAVEGIGGYLNAFTGEESTCFYAKARHDQFDHLLDVLMDMFLQSTFDRKEIEKERGVIKEELAMYLDQPHQHVHELLNETLWPNHPLGRSLTGTEATIDAMRRTRLIEYQRRNYVAAGTLITAAGNIRHAQLCRAVGRFAGKFTKGPRPSYAPVQDEQTAPRIRLYPKETAQMQVALGIRTCSRHDDRRFALRLLNTMLGENMSSRLFQVVREDHGLAYSIHSSLSFFDDIGALTISAGLDHGQFQRAFKLVMQELKRFRSEAPTARDMQQARDFLMGQIDLSLENTENQMMWLGDQLLGYGKVVPPEQIKHRLSEVTRAQVRQAANDFLRPERMSLAMVSQLRSAKGIERALVL